MNISAIVERLATIHRYVEADRAAAPEREVDLSRVAQSSVDAVTDRASGLNFAAACIGHALFAVGGDPLLANVAAQFEIDEGEDAAAWLDARWNGIGCRVS